MLVATPSPVDITVRGRRMQRGYKVWPVGVDLAKGELYGWLRFARDDGDPPPGYCHFPEYGEEYFRQLTAEHLVTVANRRTGRVRLEWQVLPNRENHHLDARIYARAAVAVLGIDRLAPVPRAKSSAPASSPPPEPPPPEPREQRRGGWLGGRRGGWLGGRRR